MKNLRKYIITAVVASMAFSACKRDDKINIVNGTPSAFIANLDLRRIYRGGDITLTSQTMRQAEFIKGQVVSDHSAGNLPQGLLFVQNAKNMGGGIDSLRGIAINIGGAAATFVPGDSVHVRIDGGVLTRLNGILQITGLTAANVEKKASNVPLRITRVSKTNLVSNPERHESTLSIIYNCNFEPNIGVETVEGVKIFNEGSGEMAMNVNNNATFKNELLPYSANIQGIIVPAANGEQQIRPRIKADFMPTSLTVDASVPLGPNPVIITGFFADPTGTDANYEYVQLMATQDLDFRQKPFCVITTNNAGANTPAGFPTNGWHTGGLRTYKLNILRGTVAKGTFFYVGGNKVINGAGSTDISNANWVVSKMYSNVDGDDGIGTRTTNLLANTGNPGGIAVFPTTDINLMSIPSDVVFYAGTGGDIFGNGVGYSICDNDFYKRYNGTTFQPFYRQGTNTARAVAGNPNATSFVYLGGTYDATAKAWTGPVRTGKYVLTPKALDEIEGKGPDPTKSDVTKLIN